MIVVDSSALLAYLWGEPGHQQVENALDGAAAICTVVNWCEVATKVLARGGDWNAAETALLGAGLGIVSVEVDDAVRAARLWVQHRDLSMGDRLCLAIADRLDATILTADHAWQPASNRVQLIR